MTQNPVRSAAGKFQNQVAFSTAYIPFTLAHYKTKNPMALHINCYMYFVKK